MTLGNLLPGEATAVESSTSFSTETAAAMRSAFEQQKQGALLCESAAAKRIVFFEEGHLVGARSDLLEERLGEVMVREGRITRAELDEATRYIRSGRKLGHILVELSYLRAGEIENFVRLQIIEIAARMLVSVPERLVFMEEFPVEATTLAPISIGDVFLEASKRLTDISLYRENVLVDDYVLTQTEDAIALAPGMKLREEEAYVLDLVDGRNTVGEILPLSPLGDDRTVRILVALHQAGIVGLKEKRQSSMVVLGAQDTSDLLMLESEPDPFEKELLDVFNNMQCQNHWQVLGLQRNASYEDIERAHSAMVQRFAAEKHAHIANLDFQERLSYVLTRIKEAFVILSSQTSTTAYRQLEKQETQYEEKKQSWEDILTVPEPASEPETWERPKSLDEAKGFFQQAKRCYKEGDYWRTIELCRSAIELSGENDPEQFHLLGKALLENPRWRKDAEKNFQIAIKLKPWEPRYLVSLAKLYEKEGLHQRAARLHEQLKVMDPTYAFRRGDSNDTDDSAA